MSCTSGTKTKTTLLHVVVERPVPDMAGCEIVSQKSHRDRQQFLVRIPRSSMQLWLDQLTEKAFVLSADIISRDGATAVLSTSALTRWNRQKMRESKKRAGWESNF